MLFFSREQVELVLISVVVLPDSQPSPGEMAAKANQASGFRN